MLTRPQAFARPQSPERLVADVRQFEEQFLVYEDSRAVTEELLRLLERFSIGGKQVHDANIVATMLVHDAQRIRTANVDDFTRFASLIAVHAVA